MIRQLPTTDQFAVVPSTLLYGGYQDLAVVVWSYLRLLFGQEAGPVTYAELSADLGLDAATRTSERRLSIALQPLLGTWVVRRRSEPNLYQYAAVAPRDDGTGAIIRHQDLALLTRTRTFELRVLPSDIADFARWQLECGVRGWTAESTQLIAKRWKVTRPTVRASRRRLADRGLLRVEYRDLSGRLNPVVWLGELHEPNCVRADVRAAHRPLQGEHARPSPEDDLTTQARCRSDQRLADVLRGRPDKSDITLSLIRLNRLVDGGLPAAAWTSPDWWDSQRESAWSRSSRRAHLDPRAGLVRFSPIQLTDPLTEIRRTKALRRYAALVALASPRIEQDAIADRRLHDVYLLHFPAEGCFKVGIARVGAGRINYFLRHGAIEVDRATVDSARMAELVEADVLAVVDEWRELGDRNRPGGGFTEMWSDAGPTVDLSAMVLMAEMTVDRVRAASGTTP